MQYFYKIILQNILKNSKVDNVDDANEITSLAMDMWNNLPHKFLGGKAPAEMK